MNSADRSQRDRTPPQGEDPRPAGRRELHSAAPLGRTLVALFLCAVLFVLAFRFFAATRFVVLGTLAAAALAATLRPVTDHLPGPSIVRAATGTLLLLCLVAGLVFGLGCVLQGPIRESVEHHPEIRRRANEGLQALAARMGIHQTITVDDLGNIAATWLTGGSPAEWIPNLAHGIFMVLLTVLVVFVGAIYLLARPASSVLEPAVRLLPPAGQDATREAIKTLQPQLRGWLLGTGFSMLMIGLVSALGYWLIGLAFALPVALFAGIAQAIPTFGPAVTLVLSLLIAATQGTAQLVGVVVVYAVVQGVESNFLTPLVMRRAVRIPPIVTLFTILLWGNVFGVAGLFLAVPIDLTIWSFLKHHFDRSGEDAAAVPASARS